MAVNVGPSDDLREVAYQAMVVDAEFPFVKDFDGQVVRAVGAERGRPRSWCSMPTRSCAIAAASTISFAWAASGPRRIARI